MLGDVLVPTVVRFTAALTIPDIARLDTAYGGLRLDRPVPPLGYLERLPAATVDALSDDFLVEDCLPLDPAQKLAPWLSGAPGPPLDLIAVLFDDADPEEVVAALDGIGARDVAVLDDPASLPQVAAIGEVLWVEPAPVFIDFNVEAAQTIQSGRVGPGSNPIWDKGLRGRGQIIGIIEKGTVDISHCFFADNAGPGPSHRKLVRVFNKAGQAPEPHFMFVAGIAVGDDRNSPGTHQHRGGAWEARLVCRNLHDMVADKANQLSFLDLFRTARDAGARIHNFSWGEARISSYTKLARDVDTFTWENEDHVVIAAGANTGGLDNAPPGIAKNALCVAAAEAHPNHMTRGSGISGPTNIDHRRKPEIMAVGCDISSALLAANKCATGLLLSEGRCATSWAAPNAAAAAALVRQYFVDGWYPSGKPVQKAGITPSGALIKAVLLNSTVDMTGQARYPSNAEGWGLIQLDRALYFDGGSRRLAVKDVRRADGMESGEVRGRILLVASGSEKLKITLVWTEPPPSEDSFRTPTVNTVQLAVTAPNGITYWGNDIDTTTGLSKPNGSGPVDQVNNVQMVIVDNPVVGSWFVAARATVRAGKRQGFALVASGDLVTSAFI